MNILSFDAHFPNLDGFIEELVKEYQCGEIKSWEDLEEKVNAYFTPQIMEQMEALVPGWQKMASYSGGITLVHVMCVFLGLFMLPEFQSLSEKEQQIAKWMILFHDVEKEVRKGERDTTHAFRSAAITARQLPQLGFIATAEYGDLVGSWSDLIYSAIRISGHYPEPVQDNAKLPEILMGIESMFGHDTPAALIVKSVLLHMSINVVHDWPQAAPLNEQEVKRYVSGPLASLLKVMMLADNEGWSMFHADTRKQQRADTLQTFQSIDEIISS